MRNLCEQAVQLLSLEILIQYVLQTSALKCAVCRKIDYKGIGPQQSEMDNLLITYNLPRPYCRYLDEIQCDRDQDVCVTITTNMKQSGTCVVLLDHFAFSL